MDYDNIIYFIAPNQKFHFLNLFRNKHSKEQKNSTLFYGQLQQFSKGFSYEPIVQWELLHKSKDFSINILNLF
jgi:hypothetical protein